MGDGPAVTFVMDPGGVPLPPHDPRYVYRPETEKARFFLTGGLPRPDRVNDGHSVCPYCETKQQVQRVTTHVPGTTPVSMIADHACRQKVA